MAMPCHRAVCALLVHLAVMSSVQGEAPILAIMQAPTAVPTGIDMTRPGWFSRDALNFAREEGTGFFFTTGHFKGTNVLAYKDVCNMQTCFKVTAPRRTSSCFQVPSVKMQSNGRSDIFLAKYGPRNQVSLPLRPHLN